MNFTHYDLGVLSGGATVIVTLQGTANVRLTDRQLFGVSRERSAPYIGGHATRSPARLQVPSAGHGVWLPSILAVADEPGRY